MRTPSSIKEESDLSSGPPSSDSGYEATPNYVTMSSSSDSSPRRPYFNSMYDRDDQDFLDCPYDSSMQTHFSMNGSCRSDQRQSNVMHPLSHQSHPQPQSPLFYNQNYTGYPFYNTGYYPNALGITPCQENTSTSTSSAAAVAVAAASSTAAAAAAAVALMRSPAGSAADLLSHQDHYSSMPSSSNNTSSIQQRSNANAVPAPPSHFASYQPLNMPENAFSADL
jgi:hypothetical protein